MVTFVMTYRHNGNDHVSTHINYDHNTDDHMVITFMTAMRVNRLLVFQHVRHNRYDRWVITVLTVRDIATKQTVTKFMTFRS